VIARAVTGISLALALLTSAAPAARAAGELPWAPVTDARLLHATADDGSLMYRRAYDSQGYAPFAQIDATNVANLAPVFTYKTGLPQGHEAAPIVNGRYLFFTTPLDHVVALDATNGTLLWTYDRELPPRSLRGVCCDVVNRGLAVYGDRVFLETLDDHLVALDARTGHVEWDREVAPSGTGYSMTSAPLIVNGKAIVGVSGGEYGIRGFVAAYDTATGEQRWKRYTVASERGGGGAWLTGSYDPATKTLFWGTGNPGPWRGDVRPGPNLYSDSLLALDPNTGALKWYFQWTPHDEWDYDGVNETVLVDIVRSGKPLHALFHADRNGQFVVLDRTNGKFVYATPLVKTTGVTGYDAHGVARVNPAVRLTAGKTADVCPSAIGGKNWWPTAFDPALGVAYVPLSHMCMTISAAELDDRPGAAYLGADFKLHPEPGADGFGEVVAIDVATGAKRWSHPSKLPWCDGMLATGGKLVFSGSADGAFTAFDARTGAVRWTYKTDSGIIGVPISYRVDGKQYVAVLSGWGGGVSMFGGPAADATANVPRGGKLYVFALAPNAAAAAPASPSASGAPSSATAPTATAATVPAAAGAVAAATRQPAARAMFASPEPRALTFTAAQAADGARIYGASCALCHGAKLEGVSAPPLRADTVADAKTPTVGEYYRIIAKTMPKTNPGSLTPAQAAAVLAYLLGANGASAGEAALTPAEAAGSGLKYVRH
jgi:alcohol dehydrogenase (cytochrome c)